MMDMINKIPDEWNDTAKSIIDMGKHLAELKPTMSGEELARKVYADYGINHSSIDKIIRISQHPILSNPENADKLPNSWALLYEMRFLPDELLLEKLNNGELRKASKYTVWEWRGVKTKRLNPTVGKNEGSRVRVPDNISLVAYVNVGMQKEPEFNGDLVETAKCLGIGLTTYRQVRQIVLLSQHPSLSSADSELVQGLIDRINKTRNVREYYLKAKPLIERVWGGARGAKFTDKNSQKRVDAYLNAVFLVGISAQRLSDMERPYMSIEDTDKVIGELSDAGTIIRKLAETLRRSKND